MKSAPALFCLLLAAPLTTYAAEQIIPAGSLISCTLSEPKLNSRTTAVGDPVLCRVGHTGHSHLPYDSYLVGRFENYKDPGHLVGKGWMELTFDHMVIEPDTEISVDARVVDVPGYNVDRNGRILGKGHAVRDTVTWMLPILWPIDLINLPRRGPRPTLKEETRLTLKVMDDLEVPKMDQQPYQQLPNGLLRRQPSAYDEAPAPPPPDQIAEQQQPEQPPVQPQPQYQPQYAYQPAVQPVVVTPPPVIAMVAPPPPVYYMPRPVYAPPPMRSVVVIRNGYAYRVWVQP